MKFVVLLMKVHLKSAYSALRNDTRTKIAFFISFSLSCGIGLWSISQLLVHISQWYATASALLEVHLWLLYVGAWIGIGLFAALSTMTLGFGGEQPRLLMTLPIPAAARFRVLYALMLFVGIGNWLLLEVVVIGLPLIIMLGWQAFMRLLLLLLGVAFAVWMSIVSTLLVFRYVIPNLIDYAPYAISSEGSRLIFYLVAQTGITMYLRSRLIVLLIAALLVGLTLSLVLSWWMGLSMIELVQTLIMVSMIMSCYTSFSVLGSTWDEDLNLVSEGMMPTITQEHQNGE